ncbi:MAG: hypothetical protein WC967_07950 [Balneolaceae bacterium]
MRKITASERKIIESLIFPEPFEVIMEETEFPYGTLRDDLINLVNYRYVEVVNLDPSEDSSLTYFDSDNIRECTFRATKIGLKILSSTNEVRSNSI